MRAIRAVLLSLALCCLAALPAVAQSSCSAEQPAALLPQDPAFCARLAPVIRRPGALPLEKYEEALGSFFRSYCHRDETSGWKRDKRVRDTGPFTATLQDGQWAGAYHGTHAPVVIWYSPEMLAWMKANRPVETAAPETSAPIPDGAVIVKEMFPAPAAACAGVDPVRLLPTSGAAVMVRDRAASQDGWFWGWFGWSGWDPDYPTGPQNRYPYMGFGQYCVNCHASAQDNHTFSSLRNVEGEPGEPLVFLSQHFFNPKPVASHHRLVSLPTDDAPRLGQPLYVYNRDFTEAVGAGRLPRPTWETVPRMPSETYDNVWVQAGSVTAASQFVTSSQCIGCHDAGGTGCSST
ncbi:MAG: cytochrome P460 family protein [Thermoanaerobaculia bacterium]